MSKLDKDGTSITILNLARGNILGNNSNPPGKSIGPTLNLEQQRRTASPKLSANPQEGSLIHKVGIIELLEQDERPTFIIDVSNQENYIPGGRLRLEYANASLRAMIPLLEMVAGFADLSSPTIVTHAFPEFKAWVLSFVNKESESLDICLPSFLYGGFTWSCSTLRKRLRVMNGVRTQIPTTNSTSSNANNSSPAIPNPGFVIGQDLKSSTDLFPEPSDYFGDVATVVPDSGPTESLLVGNKVAQIDGSSFDWTRLPLNAALPRHIQFTRNVNCDMSSQRSLNSGSMSQAPCCVLEGTIGVPSGHQSAATPLDLHLSEDGFAPYLRECMRLDRPVLLTTEEGTLPAELIKNLECVGFGDPCRAAVAIPLHATSRESILGFLVMGVNPRRPYDDDYSLFVELMTRQLATSMASVVLYEEEIRKGQKAARIAAQDRQELSELVNLRTQEAVESESRFTRMAEMAPVGMFIANSQGEITFSNDAWWEISRHPRSDNSAKSWMESIKEEDREGVQATWNKLVAQKVNVTKEFRFKTPWQSKHALTDTWALMNCTSLRDKDNNLMSIFGCITDISHQKWAEEFQKQKTKEAIELKRQQENFIDMTSHEMRNPLSAILQCSDEITSALTAPALKGLKSNARNMEAPQEISELIESSIDAAQTIALCAQHQKRIVDDILTLSKLDSALLVVAPVSTQPISVARRAIKMFEGDMEKHDISIEFQIQDSYTDLNINWAKLDPSRLLQVLINLLTNAIKFTTGQPQRSIIVSIGATKEHPANSDTTVQYFPSRSGITGLAMDEAEWGPGENLYLKFAVQDTGRGLDEKRCLGLFISRELTELQGGQIGVSSEKGVGSCFAFYVKARRAERSPETSPLSSPNYSAMNRKPSSRTPNLTAVENINSSLEKPVHTQSKGEASTSVARISPRPKVDYKDITILIVEDNLVNQRVLQKQLHRAGFVTQVSNHGLEALHKLEASSFWKNETPTAERTSISCVLMDLEMPIMDGLTCTKKIRALEADGTIVRHVPIIAVTANARLEQIETALATGMDDVVSKPFRMPDLIPKVEALVIKSQAGSKTELE
ncbi:hsp90-like protein [Botrytis cinerea]